MMQQTSDGEFRPFNEPTAEEIRCKFLKEETTLKQMGLIHFSLGIVLMIVGVALLLGGNVGEIEIFLFASLIVFAMGFGAMGLGLMTLQNWSRTLMRILAFPLLILFPIGTAMGLNFLSVSRSRDCAFICSERYRQIVANTRHVRYEMSKTLSNVFLIVVAIAVVIGTIVYFTETPK